MTVLTVYSRPDCHLCDQLVAELEPLVAGIARIDVVDISEDRTLKKRFGLQIPVLMHNEEELSRYRLDRGRLIEFIGRLSP